MKASDLLVRCLENEGVEFIFGVPGEENADVMISLLESSIRFIVTRHEQGAAFMADAYGRLTKKPAVCLGTLGPGATNLLTGVGNANMDRSPVVVLTGQAATTRIHKESHQAMDLVALFDPCVKWGAQVQHPDSIPEIVRKAFRIATTDKYGAAHIDLPENIAHAETIARPVPTEPVPRGDPNPDAVAEAARAIREARFPVLLTGNGVFRNDATGALRAFVQATGIPAANTFMGKGGVPPGDPLCLFTVGLGSRDYPAVAIERADCVVAVGFDMVEYHPRSWNRGNEKEIVHIDSMPAEIDENYRTSVELVGSIRRSLDALRESLAGIEPPAPALYADLRESMQSDFAEHDSDDAFPVRPQRILADVRRVLDDEDIVLSDVGAHKMWIARHLQTAEPNTILISNGFCSMGFALPGALGAKLACPDRRVLAICGDGGVMMNIQELETAVREKLNVVVMVWTDSQYGLIKWKQEASFGKHSHIDFTNPDWMKLADAFGMAGFSAESASDVAPLLEQAFSAGRPALVVVPVDYDENMKLTRMLSAIPFDELCGCLDRADFLKDLPERSRRSIAEQMGEAAFSSGETVFREGDTGDTVYFVTSGRVSVRKGESEVRSVGPNEAFGEISGLLASARAADAVATEDTVCATLQGADYRELIRSDPQLGVHLAAQFARRFASS
ncbi:MAG: acetolactate synthase large subunit [Planctomycetota bacterium]|jgi:acetolactate synthase-1/2/3 large subunit